MASAIELALTPVDVVGLRMAAGPVDVVALVLRMPREPDVMGAAVPAHQPALKTLSLTERSIAAHPL